jgi:nucleotide-binding universal stress UspA family protein
VGQRETPGESAKVEHSVRATDEHHVGAESTMSEFSDDQLVDFVLGLGTDHGLGDAVRAEPELRRRCSALKTELRHLDEEFAELLANDSHDGILTKASWRILLAVDGSSGSRKAALAALALALRSDGVVEVLHVCEFGQLGRCLGPLPGETRAEAAALIGPVLGELRGRGVMVRGQLRSAPAGLVARNIVWEAEEIAADIIVIGSSSSSRLAALWASRVGAAVVRKARCPVLVVR